MEKPEWNVTREEIRTLGPLCDCLDLSRVRLHRGGGGTVRRGLRRLVLLVSGNRGVALGNHVFLPDHAVGSLPVLAHELMHCAQYQRWGAARYFARAAAERLREIAWRLGAGPSPYVYRVEDGKLFDAYRMEQQGQIVEDCFRGSPIAAAILPDQLRRPDPPRATESTAQAPIPAFSRSGPVRDRQ
jgi:hypothetical protein